MQLTEENKSELLLGEPEKTVPHRLDTLAELLNGQAVSVGKSGDADVTEQVRQRFNPSGE